MEATKYWIAVASKDHIAMGVKGGFMQVNHGKAAALKRMHTGDWLIYYSPKEAYEGKQPLQAFTAIGRVRDEKIYQGHMSAGFQPFRRNIDFHPCKDTPISPLITQLDFIENKKSWGYKFRFGFFEIGEKDFKLIREKMIEV